MSRAGADEMEGRVEPRSPLPRGVQGRKLLLASLALVVAVGGVLGVQFGKWRSATLRRIELGKEMLLPGLDPLENRKPEGVEYRDWLEASRATRAMMLEVIGTGQLDRGELKRVRAEVDKRVASAAGDGAVAELRKLWDEMERLKGRFRFRLAIQRPSLLRDEDASRSSGGTGTSR